MKSATLRTIGIIVGPHGLKGEVALKPWDEDAAWVGHLKLVYVFKKAGPEEMAIQWARPHGHVVILKLKGVSTREEAERLKGLDVKATETDLPALEADEYYIDHLIGLSAKSQDSGKILGVIQNVYSSDAGDFLEIVAEGLPEPVLVPFQTIFVPHVDPLAGTVYLTGLDTFFKAS